MDILYWLSSLEGKPWNLGLERMKHLLEKLKNPHETLKCVHVAGSNGKGSVCAMLSSVYSKAGYKVGMYTSPHLVNIEERFQINQEPIEKTRLEELLSKIRPHATNQTYFEILTAAAFLYFSEEKVDIAIIEVGLGGRLDATNVITPLVSIITNVVLEHTKHLGETIDLISHEKAGIIKENVPTITNATDQALLVIQDIAKKRNSSLIIPKVDPPKLSLLGSFQKNNSLLVKETINLLQESFPVSKKDEERGFLETTWPGRFERKENIIFDSAHNAVALKILISDIKKLNYQKLFVVIGIMEDKDTKEMVEELGFADEIIFTKPKLERSADPTKLATFTTVPSHIIEDSKKALEFARKNATKDDLILVTGSIYLVGEVRFK